MIKMISIPRLKLAQLQTLTESALSIASPIALVADQIAETQTVFDDFKEGLLKDQAASDKKTLDQTRDKLISGFMLGVKAENNFGHDDAGILTTLREVTRVADKYGTAIIRLSYNEQSARVDNMLEELSRIDLTNVPTVSRWIDPIRDANENFKVASTDYVKEIASTTQFASASTIAPDLLNKLEGLFTLLFAYAQVSPTEELTKTYAVLSTLVDSYR